MPFHRVKTPVTVYKSAYGRTKNDKHVKALITLRLPVGTTYHIDDRYNHSISIGYRKCRATRAKVVKITTLRGTTKLEKAVSFNDCEFEYVKGRTVRPREVFCRYETTCASGIHFFFKKSDAIYWGRTW